jgi:unsaturated rhamnogalacturonyl hydrolase
MFLSLVPLASADPVRRMMVSALNRQIAALVELQDPKTGLWHTLLNDPSSYVETSAAAGFAAGIMMGVQMVRSRCSSSLLGFGTFT